MRPRFFADFPSAPPLCTDRETRAARAAAAVCSGRASLSRVALAQRSGLVIGGRFQQPQQERIATLVVVACLICHTGRDSMTNEKPKPEDAASPPGARRSISTIKDPAYWRALGEFIETFASAETMLFNCNYSPLITVERG
jgi:hypothetical protein